MADINQLTNDSSPERQPWPIHSSQFGLAKELLEAGISVGLTYVVIPKEETSEYRNERA